MILFGDFLSILGCKEADLFFVFVSEQSWVCDKYKACKSMNNLLLCFGQIEESMNNEYVHLCRILLGQLSVLKRTCMHIIQILFRNYTNYYQTSFLVLKNKYIVKDSKIQSMF